MENKKPDSNQGTPCEKFTWCKYHHVVAPLVIALLFIGVFMAGLAIGHEFTGEEGGHNERDRWEESDYGEKGFFHDDDMKKNYAEEQDNEEENKSENYTQEKNLKTNNEQEVRDNEDSVEKTNATSTVNQ